MNKIDKFIFISRLLKFIGVCISFGILFVLLFPAITMTSGSASITYGPTYSFVFGGSINTHNASYSVNGISIILLIAFMLLVISYVLFIISYYIENKNYVTSKWLTFIPSILILISSTLAALSHKNVAIVLADTLIKMHSDSVSHTIFNNSNLEFGVYGVAILGFTAAFLVISSLIFDGTFDRVREKIGII